MKMPGFNAESSLDPTMGIYWGKIEADQSNRGVVSMQLDDPLFDRTKALTLKKWDSIVKDPGPEFGTQTCDTGSADCAKRCIHQLNDAYDVCSKILVENKRLQCFEDARTRGARCQTNCSKSFPPSPACPPIGF